MFRRFVILWPLLILTACQTKMLSAVTEAEVTDLSCEILKKSAVTPTRREWETLGSVTRRQIKQNPAMQKVLKCDDNLG
jgi:hypothetical protein